MKYFLFVLGFFSWIDWLPYVDFNLLNNFNLLIIIIFGFNLIYNIRNQKKFNQLQVIFLVYSFYSILVTLINGEYLRLTLIINYFVILLLLGDLNTNSKYIFNGFIFGGFFTGLYMFLTIFDLINIVDYRALSFFNLSEYFINNKNLIISIGFTDKYNKLSYLFSFLTLFIFVSEKINYQLKLLFILAILFLQIKTTGRGGLIVSILFLFISLFKGRIKYSVAMSFLILLVIGFLLNPDILKIDNRYSFSESSSLSRINQYSFALENFSYSPIFGVGYSPINELIDAPYIHNFFLNNLYMGGVIGLIFSILIIFFVIKTTLISSFRYEVKIFVISFTIIQSLVENFNPTIVLGSYLVFWFLMNNKNIYLPKNFIK